MIIVVSPGLGRRHDMIGFEKKTQPGDFSLAGGQGGQSSKSTVKEKRSRPKKYQKNGGRNDGPETHSSFGVNRLSSQNSAG